MDRIIDIFGKRKNCELFMFVLIHDTRSNDSRSNDTRFMHKLNLSLHAHKQAEGGIHPMTLKDSKILLSNSDRA